MSTVEVFTKARMQAIEDQAIVDARLDTNNLILIRNNEEEIDVGSVRGPAGTTPTVPDEVNWNADGRVVGASPVGGAGVPPLKIVAGTTLINTNTDGRDTVFFPGGDFLGVSSIVCQIGQITDVVFTHINGTSPGTYGVSIENVQVFTDNYAVDSFRLTLGCGGGVGAFGIPDQGIRLGGTSNVRVNWMAFGW